MLRVGTLFSGIGAAEYALRKMGVEHQVLFAGDIDKYVKKAYFANYNMEVAALSCHGNGSRLSCRLQHQPTRLA